MSKVCVVFCARADTDFLSGIGYALQSRLVPFLYSTEGSMDIQPSGTRLLTVPDYYAEYRETGNGYAGFLGTSITAKARISISPC